ncbi:YbbR-like domain-containing protein [Vulgatibacter sp.]|uniref:CdaR family protein n=1 Tax=Vulgatibacter sp. TaxID=1971226 RepID=UPI003562D5E6
MKAVFSSDLSLKVFSLVLGLVIFFAVRTEQEVTTTVGLRLVLREPSGLINTSDVPPEITVRLSGASGSIRALAPGQLGPITLDLSSFEKGQSTVRIREEQLALPPDLEVVSISPSAVSVRLEVKDRKKLPVKAILQGAPADGFVVEKTQVDPREVEVEGPRRELRDVRFVRTAPVDVTGAREPVNASVVFELPGPHARVTGGVSRAEVDVAIAVERAERMVSLEVGGIPGARRAVAVRAKLRGPKSVIDKLDEKTLRAEAVLDEDAKSRKPFAVRIGNLPEGVELLDPLPTVPRPAPPPKRR